MSLLGIDLGTSGCKVAALSADGAILGYAHREYPLLTPAPGTVELDAEQVWSNLTLAIRELATLPAMRSDPIAALSIAVSGDELLPVDRRGRVLYHTIMSMDKRGAAEAAWWQESFGAQRIYEITGLPLHAMYGLNRILWLRAHEPAIWRETWRFLCWEEFVFLRLGVEPATDYSVAGRTMAFDIRRNAYSDEILAHAELDAELLVPAYPSGRVLGKVAPAVAAALGFTRPVAVVTGGFDQHCAALGAGVTRAGMAAVGTGSVECVAVGTTTPHTTPQMLQGGYPFGPHVGVDLYCCLAFSFGGGSVLRWYRDTLGDAEREMARQAGRDPYDVITESAGDAPSSVLVLPHFEGAQTPWMDANARGAILGLTLATTRGDLVNGILEGSTYELRHNLERMAAAGMAIDELRASGGGARSPRWLQMKADITGKRVHALNVTEAGCLSSAILAGVGAGIFASAGEAAEQLVRIRQTYEPDQARQRLFEDRYQTYLRSYPATRELSHALAHQQQRTGNRVPAAGC